LLGKEGKKEGGKEIRRKGKKKKEGSKEVRK
jgi:hypothetical protein